MLQELARGVYFENGYTGGNVGVVLGKRGALLIDTPMVPAEARLWRQVIHELPAESVYGIVNTDYHPEHFIGNAAFMPTRIFGHELAAKPISKYRTSVLEQLANVYRDQDPDTADEIAQLEVYDPEIGVDDTLTLHLGERSVKVLYLDGHTPASLGVWIEDEGILFAGDNIAVGEHPTMYQSDSLAWIRSLERIMAMDVSVIVPGVGAPCGVDAIPPTIEYIREMRRRVAELFDKGASRRECVDKVGMLDFFPFPDSLATAMKRRRRQNVERVYAEVRIARRAKARARNKARKR